MKGLRSNFFLMVILTFISTSTYGVLNGRTDEKKLINVEDPREILQKTEKIYKSFKFFKSKGITEYPENTVKQSGAVLTTTFDVIYENPSKMSVSWKDSDKKTLNAFLVEGKTISLREDGKRTKTFANVDVGVISISLNEHTTLFGILDFLTLDGSKQNRSVSSKLKDLQRFEDEDIDGNLCYKISGQISSVATEGKIVMTYWIDKEKFLIKRIDRLVEVGNNVLLKSTSIEKYSDIEAR